MEEERASLLSRMIQEEAAKRLENEKRLKVQIRERHLPQGSPLSDNTPLDASDGVVTFEDGVELPDGVKFETIRVSNRRKGTAFWAVCDTRLITDLAEKICLDTYTPSSQFTKVLLSRIFSNSM
jgi:hypothetical protein